ncbi:alkylation response protein AidB-like acyl-CoA dehydrogenase [Streptomyces sp. V4I23]|uniref:acyl-CoA dehydrogenase family protein n=1 Tax=Streptomyces sp. V4I23 TaxID=3042282 RepID=UPI002782F478|nr:acyl-CoA dehydrogenase family protein [Streptomyces sp. V4I23]MDQ1013323.1 alkylation response protein AidB-like acyl-CoA dehydrogenase [Streptomyces sp. V4I23]
MSDDFWSRAELLRKQFRSDLEVLGISPDKPMNDPKTLLEELGWTGAGYANRWGGRGLGALARVVAIEEAARLNPAFGASLSAASLGTGLLLEFGDTAQRTRWLPSLATGTDVMTICMTEPESGSHLLGMRTTARRSDDGWLLNGRKWFIGNSHIATLHGVIARTRPKRNSRALSAFLVEADRPGCSVGVEHDLAGLTGFSLGEVVFEDCWIPSENLIGAPDQGLAMAHAVVTRHGKPNIGAVALGITAAVLERACSHATSRTLYGNAIADLHSVQYRIADIYTAAYTARLTLYHAAAMLDADREHDVGLIIGKLLASDAAVRSAVAATGLMGARGSDPAIGAVQLLQDALMTQAPSGTTDINRKRLAEIALGTYAPAATHLFTS